MTATAFDRFTPHACDALTFAEEEAVRLNHPYVGTEHLLLGIAHEPEGLGGRVLKGLGVSLTMLRLVVEASSQRGETAVTEARVLAPDTKAALRAAMAAADDGGNKFVSTMHLLAGLASDNGNGAMTALRSVEVDEDRLQRAMHRAKEAPVIYANERTLPELTDETAMYILHLPAATLTHLATQARTQNRSVSALIREAINRAWPESGALTGTE